MRRIIIDSFLTISVGLLGLFKVTQQTGLHFWYGIFFLCLATILLVDLCIHLPKKIRK